MRPRKERIRYEDCGDNLDGSKETNESFSQSPSFSLREKSSDWVEKLAVEKIHTIEFTSALSRKWTRIRMFVADYNGVHPRAQANFG